MKKFYFTFLTAILGVGITNAQTLTVANHAPTLGYSFGRVACSTVGVVSGGSGAGTVWTFTDLAVTTSTTNYNSVSVASTGSTSSYGSASVAVSSGASSNDFYSCPASNLNYWGGNLTIGGISIIETYTSSPVVTAKYPMSLNTSNVSSSTGTINALSFNGTFTGTCSILADGTGTLQLPGRNFTNVIRVNTTQTVNFTIPSVASGTVTQTQYDFYEPGTAKAPLLTITMAVFTATTGFGNQGDNQTSVNVLNNYTIIGINENTKEITALKIFPNPASGFVNVNFINDNAENASLEIVNILGQTVKKLNLGNEKGLVKNNVSLEGLGAGIYHLKVMVGNAVSVQKITVQ